MEASSTAHDHIQQTESRAVNNAYPLGHAMKLRAQVLPRQSRLEDAKSKDLRASETYEKLGVAKDLESCRVLREIEQTAQSRSPSDD